MGLFGSGRGKGAGVFSELIGHRYWSKIEVILRRFRFHSEHSSSPLLLSRRRKSSLCFKTQPIYPLHLGGFLVSRGQKLEFLKLLLCTVLWHWR